MMKDWVLVPRADLERITDQERHRRSGGPSPEDLDGLDEGLRVAVQIAADLLSASPHQSAPDVALEIAGFEHPTAGWCNKHYIEVAAHCLRPGPGPVPLVRQSAAAALLSSLASENERLKAERDEALENGKAARDLLESADDGIAGLARKWQFQLERAEAAEARLKEAEEVQLEVFIPWLRGWVKARFGKWITHTTAKGALADYRAAAHAFLHSHPNTSEGASDAP